MNSIAEQRLQTNTPYEHTGKNPTQNTCKKNLATYKKFAHHD